MSKKNKSAKFASGISAGEADSAFIELLLRSLCKDREFVQRAISKLPSDFFEPPNGTDPGEYARWVIADLAKEYYAAHRVPIGLLIGTHVKRFIKRNNVQQLRAATLTEIVDRIQKKKPVNRDVLLRELTTFGQARAVESIVSDILTQHESGALTLDSLREAVSNQNTKTASTDGAIVDYFNPAGFKDRQLRRKMNPLHGIGIGIFELDMHLARIGAGHVVIIMAPPKRGKTMLLQHIGVHSVLYSHYSAFLTYEVIKGDLEERFDCYTTGMTHEDINTYPRRAEKRSARYLERVRAGGGKLFVVDADDVGGNTTAHIEAFVHRCRDEGHALNSLIIDYDEFVFPNVKVKDNPIERYNLLYLDLKRISVENKLTTYIAAQTQRNTDQQKVLSMNHAASDMGKIRKADLVIGIGNGSDFHDRAVYPHIIASRHGRSGVGQYCVTDYERAMIFDMEETNKALRDSPVEMVEE